MVGLLCGVPARWRSRLVVEEQLQPAGMPLGDRGGGVLGSGAVGRITLLRMPDLMQFGVPLRRVTGGGPTTPRR